MTRIENRLYELMVIGKKWCHCMFFCKSKTALIKRKEINPNLLQQAVGPKGLQSVWLTKSLVGALYGFFEEPVQQEFQFVQLMGVGMLTKLSFKIYVCINTYICI